MKKKLVGADRRRESREKAADSKGSGDVRTRRMKETTGGGAQMEIAIRASSSLTFSPIFFPLHFFLLSKQEKMSFFIPFSLF